MNVAFLPVKHHTGCFFSLPTIYKDVNMKPSLITENKCAAESEYCASLKKKLAK